MGYTLWSDFIIPLQHAWYRQCIPTRIGRSVGIIQPITMIRNLSDPYTFLIWCNVFSWWRYQMKKHISITSFLWRETTGHGGFPSQKSSNLLSFVYWNKNKLFDKQSSCWWFSTPRRACDSTSIQKMQYTYFLHSNPTIIGHLLRWLSALRAGHTISHRNSMLLKTLQ